MDDIDSEPLRGWVVRPNVRNERLAWIAAKPRLEKLNRRWWNSIFSVTRSAAIDTHGLHGSHLDRDELDKGMQRSAFVVDQLATRFTAPERETLRLTGRLPEWFWPEYRTVAKAEPR
jgi:hypothetical protein